MVLFQKFKIKEFLQLTMLSQGLQSSNENPRFIEFVELDRSLFIATSYNSISDDSFISNEACSGVARNKNLAILKSLVEYVERKAVQESGILSSNGCAAFPIFLSTRFSKKMAKQFAFFEAVERFVWRTWWEDKEIAYQKFEVSKFNQSILFEIRKLIPLTSAYVITPAFEGGAYYSFLTIVCLETKNGVILGGAARASYQDAEYKALTEALIHALALSRYTTREIDPVSNYEKRLVFLFENKNVFLKRLSFQGTNSIQLPKPAVDQEIQHRFANLCSIHRFLFSFEANISDDPSVGYI